jgi:hypothetical protein
MPFSGKTLDAFFAELIRDISPYRIGPNSHPAEDSLPWRFPPPNEVGSKNGPQVDPLKRGGDKHVTTNNFTMNAILGQDGSTHFLPS